MGSRGRSIDRAEGSETRRPFSGPASQRTRFALTRSFLAPASRTRRLVGTLTAVATLLGAVGCLSTRISDIDAYKKIEINRVVPYPSKDELRKRAFEVIVVDRESAGIEEDVLFEPRLWVRRELEGVAASAGATIIDRSLQDLHPIRTEGVLSELEGRGASISGADYALAIRFSVYRYTATWEPAFRFLWQSSEEVAEKRGTCLHRAEIEVDIQLIEIGSNDRVARSFALEHAAEQSTRDLDPACLLGEAATSVLFETAMDEALGCLRFPLGRLLAPRGHVTAHRKARAGDRHIYRISLGSAQGIESGEEIEIRREQRSETPGGEAFRTERVIATGVATDQIKAQIAWVAIDPAVATEDILSGDVARPVMREGLLSSLSGPNCQAILEER
jgi:hypothetical protein